MYKIELTKWKLPVPKLFPSEKRIEFKMPSGGWTTQTLELDYSALTGEVLTTNVLSISMNTYNIYINGVILEDKEGLLNGLRYLIQEINSNSVPINAKFECEGLPVIILSTIVNGITDNTLPIPTSPITADNCTMEKTNDGANNILIDIFGLDAPENFFGFDKNKYSVSLTIPAVAITGNYNKKTKFTLLRYDNPLNFEDIEIESLEGVTRSEVYRFVENGIISIIPALP